MRADAWNRRLVEECGHHAAEDLRAHVLWEEEKIGVARELRREAHRRRNLARTPRNPSVEAGTRADSAALNSSMKACTLRCESSSLWVGRLRFGAATATGTIAAAGLP